MALTRRLRRPEEEIERRRQAAAALHYHILQDGQEPPLGDQVIRLTWEDEPTEEPVTPR